MAEKYLMPSGQPIEAGHGLIDIVRQLVLRYENRMENSAPAIDDATTAGKLKTTATVDYYNDGVRQTQKAATDNLWDFTSEEDTLADKYRAYFLLLDGGTASILTHTAAGDQDSAALAYAKLAKVLPAGKTVVGVFITDGTACDWDDAGGLAAQGTIHDGFPAAMTLDVPKVLI